MPCRIKTAPSLIGFLAIIPGLASAASTEKEQITFPALAAATQKKSTAIVIEDNLPGGWDGKNYSGSVRADFLFHDPDKDTPAYKMGSLFPFFDASKTSGIFYSLGQNIYTPDNISSSQVDTNDRPWAAFLYGSMGTITRPAPYSDEIEATLGIVGPAALGSLSQRVLHRRITGGPKARGWSHQLKNEPGGMLSWQRSWPYIAAGGMNREWILRPYFGAVGGNIRTYGDIGFTVIYGSASDSWQDVPIHMQPAISGMGDKSNQWRWSLFSGVEGKAVAHDIFLDGNTFATSYSVDKKPFVADLSIGAAITKNRLKISYTTTYRTREFETQRHPDIFGSVGFAIKF
jgi:hypothetical protein